MITNTTLMGQVQVTIKTSEHQKMFSEAFKKQVVRECEQELLNRNQLQVKYVWAVDGIILNWCRKNGKIAFIISTEHIKVPACLFLFECTPKDTENKNIGKERSQHLQTSQPFLGPDKFLMAFFPLRITRLKGKQKPATGLVYLMVKPNP